MAFTEEAKAYKTLMMPILTLFILAILIRKVFYD
jgi:hypothetical protein